MRLVSGTIEQTVVVETSWLPGYEFLGVIGVGLQGHPGQLLAVLAQAQLRRDYPIWVAGREFKVDDLIENEKLTCRGGQWDVKP